MSVKEEDGVEEEEEEGPQAENREVDGAGVVEAEVAPVWGLLDGH